MTYNEVLSGTFGKYMPEGVQDKVILPIPAEEENPEPTGLPTEFNISTLVLNYSGQDMWYAYINENDAELAGITGYDDDTYGGSLYVTIPSAGIEEEGVTLQISTGEMSQMLGQVQFYIDTEETNCNYDNLMQYQVGGSVHGTGTFQVHMFYNDFEDYNTVTFNFADIQFVLD